ncbi:MAG: phenylalanine--tRNA ligase subunit beta [Candidatus Methanomethylicia archaeon]|nr:phenylalanine--tRNA ligase subunit beta [Candidatus Methanomethylicia archaeon]
MPTITISSADLKALAGLPEGAEGLESLLSSIKCSQESECGDEIQIEVTSDRPDLFSTEGIARAIRSYTKGASEYSIKTSNLDPLRLTVDRSALQVRPIIMCAAVREISLGQEAARQFMQLQEKLHKTYGADRKKASIGVYDLGKVKPPFRYSAGLPTDITFVPLDSTAPLGGREILELTPKGKEYAWIISDQKRFPLLSDSGGRVLSMPPIINSEETRVTSETSDLFIDVTGLDEKSVGICLNIMVTSILERGGRLQSVEINYPDKTTTTPKLEHREHRLRLENAEAVSGLKINADEAVRLLASMGHRPRKPMGREIIVEVPPYRVDILHEVDLIEDLIMAFGLNNVPPEYPAVATEGSLLPGNRLRSRVRDLLVGAGFQEIATYMLTSREVMVDKPKLPQRRFVEIASPVSSDYTLVRDLLLPKILDFLGRNAHVNYPQRVFEYSLVVRESSGGPADLEHVAAAISDHKVSFEEIQAVAAALMKGISKEASFRPLSSPPFIEGRAAEIIVDGARVGALGEVNPEALVNFGIQCPVAAIELEIYRFIPLESLFRG